MVRVSLGHTGRNIEASSCIVLAFVFVLFGSLLRVIASITQVDLIEHRNQIWQIGYRDRPEKQASPGRILRN